jgi:predicted transcriptional regulator
MVESGLSDSAREVFVALAELKKATRPQLAAACALSKPTVSAVVAELESLRLVERNGTAYGTTGRSAAVYQVGPAACWTRTTPTSRTRRTP